MTSACMAVGVHGLALLLAWVGWQGVQSAPQMGRGLQVTTMAVSQEADAPSPQATRTPRDKPEPPRVSPMVEAALPEAAAPVPQPVRIAVSEVVSPAAAQTGAPGGGEQHADRPPSQAPAAASASSAPTAQMAPAISVSTYAIRVFRHILDGKDYPARLARTGLRGRVLIRFSITASGEATDIVIAMSSGVAALDALALEQVRAAIPYPLPPRDLQAAQRQFIVPMTYRPPS